MAHPQLLRAAGPDVIRAVQQSKDAADRDAQATYLRLVPTLVDLFRQDGSANADAVDYKNSELLSNPEGHACVTVSITGLGRWTGQCMAQALNIAQCGTNYEAGLVPSRRETHNTVTFMCPLPQRVYDAKFTVANTGEIMRPKDRRGFTRRFLEDTCTVWACVILLIKMMVLTFLVHRFFDVSLGDNLALCYKLAHDGVTVYRRVVS